MCANYFFEAFVNLSRNWNTVDGRNPKQPPEMYKTV